ncbi:uncharacterized protein METZ01_LOCUS390383 [marine metagenome]|uniref:Uncharacterized protein n=1 Tax=marine metagenome TaxID=408172 RepID=A0A382UTE8_9ZZZZ
MKTLPLIIVGLSIFALSGCNVLERSWDRSKARVGLGPNNVESIGVMVEMGEKPAAIVVEIVLAYGDATVALISQTAVQTWFAEREGFCSSYSNQLDVIRIELPMGYSAQLTQLPKEHKLAQSVFVFVRETGKVEITTLSSPWIHIVDGEIILLDKPPGAKSSTKAIEALEGAKTLC